MFRKMRRIAQELDREECLGLLKNERRATLALSGENGYPFCVPINFYYDEDSGNIYFHGAKAGQKFDALSRDGRVCFSVHDEGIILEGDWAYTVKSVIVFGTVSFMPPDANSMEILKRFAMKYYPDEETVDKTIAQSAANAQMFEMKIDHMTGKSVHEK